jgi:DNA-binding transcriptional LysR family regulator
VLRLGTTPLSAAFAVDLVTPALTVTVRVADRVSIARAVARGELEAGFVDGVAAVNDPLRLPEAGLRVAEIHEEPLAVAVAHDHPLGGRDTRLEDLVDARWIDAPAICAPLDELATLARADGFRAALHYDGSDVAGLLALVAAGHGLALLPRRALGPLAGLPLTAPGLMHRTELLRIGG